MDAELRERFSPLRVMEHESPAVLTVTNVEGAFGTTGERPEPEVKAAPRHKGGMYGGSEFKTRSTYGSEGDSLRLDIDPKTHPAWTGVHRLVDTGGQLAKFKKRFQGLGLEKE